MEYAVETRDLTRVFKKPKRHWWNRRRKGGGDDGKDVVALDEVNMEIGEGELFGLLGPNGAGKTTLIKILSTLLLPTRGQAFVAGHDVSTDPLPIRQKINMVSGGETSGYGLLTVRENTWMFSQFYGITSRVAKERIDDLLKEFGLWEKRDAKVRTLSSGQRQKMNMVRGYVTDPDIIFLDEPTLGLDVNASRVIRNYVMNWIRENSHKTVLLTTHYMMEADQMCDRIAIIDKGRILACDSPENLKAMVKQDSTVRMEVDLLKDTAAFRSIPGVKNFMEKSDASSNLTELTFIIEEESAISDVMSNIMSQGSKIRSFRKSEPTLEDVFVSMVGRGLE
jgi:ABC-2 type transport system ATP-binding protein